MTAISSLPYRWSPPRPSVAHRRISRVSPHNCYVEFVSASPSVASLGAAAPGVRTTCESQLEYHVALCAAYGPGVVSIEEQLPKVGIHSRGRARYHSLDFRVTTSSGLRRGLAVKHTRGRGFAELLQDLPAIRRAVVPTLVDRLFLVTERNLCPIKVHNAELFHGARRVEPEIDAALAGHVETMTTPMSIADMLLAAGLPGQFFAAVRAIHWGLLDLCTPEKIVPTTMVRPRGQT